MNNSIDKFFIEEHKESMKVLRLQEYAAKHGLVPNQIKYNELSSMFWNNYLTGMPHITINGKETLNSATYRLKQSRRDVIAYFNNTYRKKTD